jgi:putative nucleotidyltransferase with HDIG domain
MQTSFFNRIKLFRAAEIQPKRPPAESPDDKPRPTLLWRIIAEPWPALALATAVIAIFLTRLPSESLMTLSLGDVAPADVVAPFDLTIEDAEATADKRAEAETEVLPVYTFDANVLANTDDKIRRLFAAGREWAGGATGTGQIEKLQEILLDKHGVDLELSSVQTLARLKFPSDLEETLISLVAKAFSQGIIVSKNLFIHGEDERGLVLIDIRGRERQVRADSLVDIGESERRFNDDLDRIEMPSRSRAALSDLGEVFLTANVTYNKIETERRKALARDAVDTVTFTVKKDRVIVRKGDEGTPETLKIMEEYNKRIRRQSSWVPSFLGLFALYFFLLFTVWSYLGRTFKRKQIGKQFHMTAVALVGSLLIYEAFLALAKTVSESVTNSVYSHIDVFYYALPFQIGTLIFAFLLPDPVTLLFILLNSLTAGLLVGGDFALTVFSFIGGLATIYAVKLYRRRYRAATLRAGFIVLPAVNTLLILAFYLVLKRASIAAVPAEVVMGILGGAASAVLAFVLLPLVETLFGFVTGSKLLELTNSELPIFRQFAEEAPGSYHHSLIVASLAEKAAEELGLDAQLAKAGALYHDIGKIKMPEYFIENRTGEFDLHKDLTPSMSTLVIKNHVKEGVELARRLKLPKPLREIIEQHHGNSLVRYFYAKAKQTYDPTGQTVGEQSFRYPGPPPQTKEAGLIMLADAIEAASRSLRAPTKDNLKRVITDIINGTLQDGQLDACDFSLRELRTVASAFLTILYAIYHPRVEYPGFSFEGRPKDKDQKKGPGKSAAQNNGKDAKKDNDRHPEPPEKAPDPDKGV